MVPNQPIHLLIMMPPCARLSRACRARSLPAVYRATRGEDGCPAEMRVRNGMQMPNREMPGVLNSWAGIGCAKDGGVP